MTIICKKPIPIKHLPWLPWIIGSTLLSASLNINANQLMLADFSDISHLTLNGNAKTITTPHGTVLRLTPAKRLQSGSAFSTVKVNTHQFSTYFQFKITEPGGVQSGGDGFVFVVQPVSSDVGSKGGGIGYKGIPNSIGIEFDTWDNQKEKEPYNDHDANHVGININGEFNGSTAAVSPQFENGMVWHAWADYDGAQLEVRVNTSDERPVKPLITRKLDISTLLGGQPKAYVGFTSATGGAYANHDILTWMYRDQFLPFIITATDENTDVWMADSKRDQGIEPNKLSRRFWLSPDIWTRNQADGVEKYQNVELGQDNYIYLRLRNRGDSIAYNTTVEVYRSLPSLGNRWPKGWQFVGKTQADTLAPNSTKNLHIRWDKAEIPQPGHYCFYVRVLNNADPFNKNEVIDSLVNTKSNNNIAWRNFNVVDLQTNVTNEFEALVHNTKDQKAHVELVFEEDKDFLGPDALLATKEIEPKKKQEPLKDFLDETGTSILVDLGELYQRWQQAGGQGFNIKTVGGSQVQITKMPAIFSGIMMKAAESQPIRMQVKAYQPVAYQGHSRPYQLSSQALIDGELVGGIDYEVVVRAQEADTDQDGIKDINDEDDDNDGQFDEWETMAGKNPLDANDKLKSFLVDFEEIPEATPGMNIHHQFDKTHGMTFSSPTEITLVKVGEEPMAFLSVYETDGTKTNRQNKPNTPAPFAKVGQYLIMAKHDHGSDLTVTYQQPVVQAGGDVLDIDGGEIITLIAKDHEGHEIARQKLDRDSPHTGDGLATHWTFNQAQPMIKTIDIIHRGKGVGVAFDNFSATPLAVNESSVTAHQPIETKMVTSSTTESKTTPLTQVTLTQASDPNAIQLIPEINNQVDQTLTSVRYVFDLADKTPQQFQSQITTQAEPTLLDLIFEEKSQLLNTGKAKILVDLDTLYERWQHNSAEGDNLEIIEKGSLIRLVNMPAKIIGIPFTAKESPVIDIQVIAPDEIEAITALEKTTLPATKTTDQKSHLKTSTTPTANTSDTIYYLFELAENVVEEFTAPLSNLENKPTDITLSFDEKTDLINTDKATMLVELGSLFHRWQESGHQGNNITVIDDDTQIQILKTPATIATIPLKANESKTIPIKVDSLTKHKQPAMLHRQYTFTTQKGNMPTSTTQDKQETMTVATTQEQPKPVETTATPAKWNAMTTGAMTDSTKITTQPDQTDHQQPVRISPLETTCQEEKSWTEMTTGTTKPSLPASKSPTISVSEILQLLGSGEGTIHFKMMPGNNGTTAGLIQFEIAPGTLVPLKTMRMTGDYPRYTDNNDQTVIDNKTGLIWLQNANCIGTHYPNFARDHSPGDGRINWRDAQTFITKLNAGQFAKCNTTYTDWRLPTLQEMQSLVHYGYVNPALSNAQGDQPWQEQDAFTHVKSDNYWTATVDATQPTFSWRLRMDRGIAFTEHQSYSFYVWPVRDITNF